MRKSIRSLALVVPLALAAACQHAQHSGAMARPSDERQHGEGRGEEQGASVDLGAGQPLAEDPIMRPGPGIQGHAGDEIVVGRIAAATGSQVVIQTAQGDTRTLQIVPQTEIQLDGEDASSDELAEGQEVRASFDRVDGQPVAVKIRAGELSDESTDDAALERTGPSGGTPDAGWAPPGSGR